MRRALLGVLGALLVAAPAHAATFNVTTTADGTTCDATTCTLGGAWRSALNNGSTEDDVINVPAGTYGVAGGLSSSQGQAPTRITIAGRGANSTVITQPAGATSVLAISGTGTFTVSDATIQGGGATALTAGGNVSVSGGTLNLVRVRVTGGTARNGGGIAITASAGTSLVNLVQSLVDGNHAIPINGTAGIGGGVYVSGATSQAQLTATDSTILGNDGMTGAGIEADTNARVSLAGVTLARNIASGTLGGGIRTASGGSAVIQGSIIDANKAQAAGAPVQVDNNCSFTAAATDLGGNIDSKQTCGFANLNNTDAKLAAALDGESPPVLTIPADSPARDIASCGTRVLDQRGVARPQGLLCDAGAYEYQAPVVVTPTPTPTVAPTVVPTATPTPAPTPAVNKTVVVAPVSGKVTIKVPGAKSFAPLNTGLGVPVGSTVDTRDGKVELTSVPKAGGKPETATFYDGIFKVTQSKGITNLTLTEALAACPKSAKSAHAAAKKPKTRRLWGSGKGNFRTTGKYSAATIRGTTWLVQDSCAGTTTTVKQGVVTVRDNVKHKTIIVKAPHHYLARPKK